MLRGTVAALCAAVLFGGCLPQTALAQSDQAGTITIVVTDAATKAPITLARVLLDGPVITTEFTDNSGIVSFIDVPDGIYQARIIRRGYDSVSSAQFEVLEGKAVQINVALAISTSLKVIATVAVKSTADVSTSEIGDDSPQRMLSSDLVGALGKLAGVSVTSSSADSDATETISLDGEDASQTALTLDGIPLNAAGSAGDVGQYSSCVFTGARVSYGPQAGGLAGGVNFSTVQPTLSWVSNDQVSLGTNGASNLCLGESGSSGKFAFAATAGSSINPSLLDGMTYLDSSGLDYSHDGDRDQKGEVFKLRYKLSDAQSLTAEFLGSATNSSLARSSYCGAIPCGYGPNNGNSSSVQLFSLMDNALIGDTTLQVTAYGSVTQSEADDVNRFVDGAASPIGSTTLARNTGFNIVAELPAKERHTFSINATHSVSSITTTPLVPQAQLYYNSGQQSSYSTLQLVDRIQSSTKLRLSDTFGFSQSTNAPVSIIGSAGFNWAPTAVDSYSFSYAIGGSAPHPGRSTILTDPAGLTFNCNGDVADGVAPGDLPGRSSSTSANFSYTHKWRNEQISASLYRQVQNGIVLPTLVNGTAIAGELPPGYVGNVADIFNSPAGCDTPPGTPFGLQQLYFNTAVGGVSRVYQGVRLNGYATLGNFIIEPWYTITSATVRSGDPRIDNPYSYIISGSQVPNTPLHTASLVVGYTPPHSVFQYLADAQYTGANNRNNLPAYTQYDAAVQAQLQRGELRFLVQNITNTYGGIFTSPANAVPYQTAGGTLVGTLARPLTPRSIQVDYQIRFGQGVVQRKTSLVSTAGGGGGRGGRGGFRGGFTPLGAAPPTNPLDVNTATQCTADGATFAHALLDPLKTYVAQIEAAKTATGYPATMPPPPAIPGWGVEYHSLGTTYALTITPKTLTRGVTPCLVLHIARPTDVTARHLYVPTSPIPFIRPFTFMPAVGLYITPQQQQAGQETFRAYPLPTAPPKAPFAVQMAPACTPVLKASATALLGELQAHFASGAPTPDWQITAKQAKAGTYYELTPSDLTGFVALLSCGHVSTAATDDLTKLGWDGARLPVLNYTPALGVYSVRFGGPGGPGGGGPGGQGGRRNGGNAQNAGGNAPPGDEGPP
jgi:hypothetical protein